MNHTDNPADHLRLEDQAALGSGAAFWNTKAFDGIPSFILTDGPHGVRRQISSDDHLGIAPSSPATCFPPAVGLAQSWDPDLVRRVGGALGVEARHRGVGVLLGPGVNIKRDARCGRNFEYYSEDPVLSGHLAAAWVDGLQSEGVGASLKHFAANNVEHDRMRSSSDVDPRTLREVYLRAFQHVVEKSAPWTVMSSYNRINGVHTSEDPWLLTRVLRDEWGFDGVVVSDWGAVVDRVESVRAGLDLEMPAGIGTDQEVVDAVRAGVLERDEVARAARRVATLAHRIAEGRERTTPDDPAAHHRLAKDAAVRSIVLLHNDGTLPLADEKRIAVIGEFAERPRFQGGGSSRVNPTRVSIPLEEIRRLADDAAITYSQGFATEAAEGENSDLLADAVSAAREADVAVLFLGLGERQESEGFDRESIDLPADQIALFDAVIAAQPRTVVVLSHGGVLRLLPLAGASAILDGALLGQAGGEAIAEILLGIESPSGRLAESVPERLQDSPAYLSFPGEHSHVTYGEGIFVGYRWYDARDLAVTYPFGHGLSYTTFDYQDLELALTSGGIEASVTVTNSGSRRGREVVQFYTSLPDSEVVRAPRELKAFTSVDLAPRATTRVTVTIPLADLAYWDRRIDSWVVEGGTYEVAAAASSRDLRQVEALEVPRSGPRVPISASTTIGEAMADTGARAVLGSILSRGGGSEGPSAAETELGLDIAKMMASFPLDRMPHFGGTQGRERLQSILASINRS